ncbi:hypothetical protein T08_16358 [Trichinella sp. T8]|nr:hypothetical protein T08_16358 [Trichinella sp. T8]
MHNQCAPDPFGVTNNCVAGSENMPSKCLARRIGEVIKTNRLNEQTSMLHLS